MQTRRKSNDHCTRGKTATCFCQPETISPKTVPGYHLSLLTWLIVAGMVIY
jgi:hypothetical protein